MRGSNKWKNHKIYCYISGEKILDDINRYSIYEKFFCTRFDAIWIINENYGREHNGRSFRNNW